MYQLYQGLIFALQDYSLGILAILELSKLSRQPIHLTKQTFLLFVLHLYRPYPSGNQMNLWLLLAWLSGSVVKASNLMYKDGIIDD